MIWFTMKTGKYAGVNFLSRKNLEKVILVLWWKQRLLGYQITRTQLLSRCSKVPNIFIKPRYIFSVTANKLNSLLSWKSVVHTHSGNLDWLRPWRTQVTLILSDRPTLTDSNYSQCMLKRKPHCCRTTYFISRDQKLKNSIGSSMLTSDWPIEWL